MHLTQGRLGVRPEVARELAGAIARDPNLDGFDEFLHFRLGFLNEAFSLFDTGLQIVQDGRCFFPHDEKIFENGLVPAKIAHRRGRRALIFVFRRLVQRRKIAGDASGLRNSGRVMVARYQSI